MAFSSPSLHQIITPLHLNFTSNLASSSLFPNLPFTKISTNFTNRRRRSSTIVYNSKKEMGNVQKRELLESYGLDPDEYLSEPTTPKSKRRKEMKKNGKGQEVSVEEPKAPRTTHKLLQVLGGTAKRMKLLSPKGMDVRPMMEVVKGAAFDILQVAGGCPASLRPGRWLDLYSGTGSVGIEAISRGCSEAHFVEMDPWVISNVLRPNLEWTGFLDVSVVHAVCVEIFFQRAGSAGSYEYISVTPPYMEVDYGVLMDQISKSAIVGENTFIVVEYPLGTDMLDSCGCLVKIAYRRFGRTQLAIYGPEWAQKKRKSKKASGNISYVGPSGTDLLISPEAAEVMERLNKLL